MTYVKNKKLEIGVAPMIIAELSGNHNGSIDRALESIVQAKKAGANAIKFQTYTADTMTIDTRQEHFVVRGGLWDGRSLYELYEEAHTPWEWHQPLFEKARELNILPFSSPFDFTAVDFLETLHAPLYKIASFELVDLPLIDYVAKTGKPIIMSTGMATLDEIQAAVDCAKIAGCQDLTLLHCVSEYPAPIENCNLSMIPDLKKRFDVRVGLSDHTFSTSVAVASVALGAMVIEKHFTLCRSDGGVDSAFSIEPSELFQLCLDAKAAHRAIGSINYTRSLSETDNRKFRRSIYVVEDIEEGECFTKKNIRCIRPGYGLLPKEFPVVLGGRAKRKCSRGEALSKEMVSDE